MKLIRTEDAVGQMLCHDMTQIIKDKYKDARLLAVNRQEEVMIVTRKGGTAVRRGDKLAGMRVIPLIIAEEKLQKAEQAAGDAPLLSLRPFVRKTACIVCTGGEVKAGLIKDTFTPVVIEKLRKLGIETLETVYSGDGVENVCDAVLAVREKKPDMILCTGGMSVDPDDNTPGGVRTGCRAEKRLRAEAQLRRFRLEGLEKNIRRSFPADSSSERRWRGYLRPSRGQFCSTSRSRRWTGF